MRILHTADLHLGRRPQGGRGSYSEARYNDYFIAFEKIVDIVLERSVDCLTLGGDIFDSNAMLPATLARTEAILGRLYDARIPVIATWGNHDRPGYGGDNEFWLAFLEQKGLLAMPRAERVTTEEGARWTFRPVCLHETRFWTSGFWGAQNENALLALAEHLASVHGGAEAEVSASRGEGTASPQPAKRTGAPDTNDEITKDIVLVHSAIGTGNDQLDFATIGTGALQALRDRGRVTCVFGGHFHSYSSWPEGGPFFFVPGAPEYFDIAERARDKAVVIFDSDNGEYERLPVTPRFKHDLTIETKESDTKLFIEKELAPLAGSLKPEDLVFLRIVCPPGIPGGVWIDAETCARWLEEDAGVMKAQVRAVQTAGGAREGVFGRGEEMSQAALMEACILRHTDFSGQTGATLSLLNELWRDKIDFPNGEEFLRQAHERLEHFFDSTRPKSALPCDDDPAGAPSPEAERGGGT